MHKPLMKHSSERYAHKRNALTRWGLINESLVELKGKDTNYGALPILRV